MASVSAASMYGFRPWSSGRGHTIHVEMARPENSLYQISDFLLQYQDTYTTLPRMETWLSSARKY